MTIIFVKIAKNYLLIKIINRKSKTGYKSEITCYACEECRDCQYKSSCIKRSNSKIPLENRTKNLQVSKLFHEKRKENLKRIISPKGCELRMNRSIQAEGAFAQVKQNMKFRRFLSRGKENVLSECIIVEIVHNISRLHNKIVKNKCGIYLHHLKEVF
ncbi:TPA: transposase [Clostridioides difficile]|nr:Uncharacterised protein [Clostridioides difficile]